MTTFLVIQSHPWCHSDHLLVINQLPCDPGGKYLVFHKLTCQLGSTAWGAKLTVHLPPLFQKSREFVSIQIPFILSAASLKEHDLYFEISGAPQGHHHQKPRLYCLIARYFIHSLQHHYIVDIFSHLDCVSFLYHALEHALSHLAQIHYLSTMLLIIWLKFIPVSFHTRIVSLKLLDMHLSPLGPCQILLGCSLSQKTLRARWHTSHLLPRVPVTTALRDHFRLFLRYKAGARLFGVGLGIFLWTVFRSTGFLFFHGVLWILISFWKAFELKL